MFLYNNKAIILFNTFSLPRLCWAWSRRHSGGASARGLGGQLGRGVQHTPHWGQSLEWVGVCGWVGGCGIKILNLYKKG